jgi:hypothetical protein
MDPIKHQIPDLLASRRLSVGAVASICAISWLIGSATMITSIAVSAAWQWPRSLLPAVALGAIVIAIWATYRISQHFRILSAIPKAVLDTRCHGTLRAITDSTRRRLRPVGSTVTEVAARTDVMLEQLLEDPGIRIFRGVFAGPVDDPPVSHAVAAEKSVVLIESVSWPPGIYRTDGDGRISCDGAYIGQSVYTLTAAIGHWRAVLPRHRVTALVIVHATDPGRYDLPSGSPDLVFTLADDAIGSIKCRITRQPRLNRPAIAALAAAVSPEPVSAGRVWT